VLGGREPVPPCDSLGPAPEVAVDDLDHAVAPLTDEVVVVRIAAEPVAALALVVGERVDDPVLVEEGERPVHGREPDRLVAALAHPLPQRLGGRVVALVRELGEDGRPLRRRADALAQEERLEVCSRHLLYDSVPEDENHSHTRLALVKVVSAQGLGARFGDRVLFSGLDFELDEGEFLAVLGPNGAGKTTLARLLLGVTEPSEGRVVVAGGRSAIGYVPQQRAFPRDLPLRGRDLVRLGLDGHRFGFGRLRERDRVERALAAVGASAYADAPVGRLSGGEQQRLRIAQALVSGPRLLLADEPLLSLDLAYQGIVVAAVDAHRRRTGTPVVFVTHDVNPVLPIVDRVLYLAGGTWAIGSVDDVMTSETLSRLYGAEIDVLRVRGRVVVVGVPDEHHHEH
jgi:zinc/manganese transport system ATP-binding protein